MTGVQTCALPIFGAARRDSQSAADAEHRVELALPVESLFGVGTGGFVVGSRASA